MMIELEPLFYNRTGGQNDKLARGHEMAYYLPELKKPKRQKAWASDCRGAGYITHVRT